MRAAIAWPLPLHPKSFSRAPSTQSRATPSLTSAWRAFTIHIDMSDVRSVVVCAVATNGDLCAEQHAFKLRLCRARHPLLYWATRRVQPIMRTRSPQSGWRQRHNLDRLRQLRLWPGDFVYRQELSESIPCEAAGDDDRGEHDSGPDPGCDRVRRRFVSITD